MGTVSKGAMASIIYRPTYLSSCSVPKAADFFADCPCCLQVVCSAFQPPQPNPAAQVAHSWRTTFDIHASWESVMQNLDESIGLARYSGPGEWNDLVSRPAF